MNWLVAHALQLITPQLLKKLRIFVSYMKVAFSHKTTSSTKSIDAFQPKSCEKKLTKKEKNK